MFSLKLIYDLKKRIVDERGGKEVTDERREAVGKVWTNLHHFK